MPGFNSHVHLLEVWLPDLNIIVQLMDGGVGVRESVSVQCKEELYN